MSSVPQDRRSWPLYRYQVQGRGLALIQVPSRGNLWTMHRYKVEVPGTGVRSGLYTGTRGTGERSGLYTGTRYTERGLARVFSTTMIARPLSIQVPGTGERSGQGILYHNK